MHFVASTFSQFSHSFLNLFSWVKYHTKIIVRRQFIAKDVANWSKVIYVKDDWCFFKCLLLNVLWILSAMRHRQINNEKENENEAKIRNIEWRRTRARALIVCHSFCKSISHQFENFPPIIHTEPCMYSNSDEWYRSRWVHSISNTHMQRQWHILQCKSVIIQATR